MNDRLKIFLRNNFFFLLLLFFSVCRPVSAGQFKYHTVSLGDTLSEISQRYKVRLKDLRRWNNLRSNRIFVGQKLRVSKKKTRNLSRKFHRVVVGDTLSEISQRYKVRLKDLRRWNNLRSNRIFVGQKILIYAPRRNLEKSVATKLGLKKTVDFLKLNSSAAIVVDQNTGEVLFEKNADVALPIASLTKLMTALLIIENELNLGKLIKITKREANLERYNYSRLKVGSQFTREQLLHLALMSSENRAAFALGRTFPGGLDAFVAAMNVKSKILSMWSTKFTEPTGLNSGNISSARDLAKLVDAASRAPLIVKFSTSKMSKVKVLNKIHRFRNSNLLVRNENWDISVSKTGFIRPSGKCLAMITRIKERPYIIVTLDATKSLDRAKDAKRIFSWLSSKKTASTRPIENNFYLANKLNYKFSSESETIFGPL
ncbi:MAG: LysM peptidoglycan-binding domain-containing protein [Burkholderiaceae bacterium]